MSRRLVAFLFVAGLAGPALADPPAPGASPRASAPAYDPTQDYRNGLQALQEKNYREADRLLTKVVGAVPADSLLLTQLGLAKAGRDDLRGARSAYERAVRSDGKNIDARRELALTLIKLRGQTAARNTRELETLKTRAQAELDALKSQAQACGSACADAGRLQASVAAVEAAMAAPPSAGATLSDPSLLFASVEAGESAYFTAVSLINEKRYGEAIAALETSRKAFGPHPDVLTYLGFAHRKIGKVDEAEGFYQSALKVAPDHRQAMEYYGELKVEQGDLAGARALLARLEAVCVFGCAQAEELRRWVEAGRPL